MLLPGSDFLLSFLGRLMLLLGAIALVPAFVVRRRRRRRDPNRRRRPIGIVAISAVTVLGLILTVAYWPPPFTVPEFPALPRLLPDNAFFYRTVTDLPVAADNERWIASQDGIRLGAGFQGVVTDGVAWGMPFNLVDATTPLVEVDLPRPGGSYRGPFPITDPPYIEGLPTYGADQHYLALDVGRRQAWELISTRRWFGSWQAGAGATWSMDSVQYPTGSTIASGLPLLPGTITYAEVASGAINHMILGAVPHTAQGQFVWPARGSDGTSTDPDAPPMGSWLRLRPDADLSGLGPQAGVIARAAQRHGILLSDTGPGFGLRGTVDRRWDGADLQTLGQLTIDDFEIVDTTGVVVSPQSMEARAPGP